MDIQRTHAITLHFSLQKSNLLQEALEEKRYDARAVFDLRLETERLSLMEDFNTLLCLDQLPNVEKLWYQIETVRKALRYFNGRVLLADEVGLGKTIEAGMLIKEYVLRGLVETALILTPSSLVSQWKEEMLAKFGFEFCTPPSSVSADAGKRFWENTRFIVSSINVAKSKNNFQLAAGRHYDLVVVDEAHHLKNTATQNWKLVNALKKRFIFLLTATPVENDLMELYHLITLLKPGHLHTKKDFKDRFVMKGDLKKPKNKEVLRRLLADVMIRNTRSVVNIGLPKRWAHTFILNPGKEERALYKDVSAFVKQHFHRPSGALDRLTLLTLQKKVGSCPSAAAETLERMQRRLKDVFSKQEALRLHALARLCDTSAKARKLVEIIGQKPQDKILVFVHYKKTLEFLSSVFEKHNIMFRVFHGGLSLMEKDAAIAEFAENIPVLLATESGGEGRNMQFCRTMVNYDLPWNPMSIEQRIGRIHRFGQKNEVFIFNLALQNSMEQHILDILDAKLNMFELVVGEMDMILGNIGACEERREFEELIMHIWTRQKQEEVDRGFKELGEELVRAKEQYGKSKELDRELFEEDYQL